jgi:hypothetical protein
MHHPDKLAKHWCQCIYLLLLWYVIRAQVYYTYGWTALNRGYLEMHVNSLLL